MPIEPGDQSLTIKGNFPNVRYFSFVVYNGQEPTDVAGHLYDAQIAPDPGSQNPFVKTKKTRRYHHRTVGGTYTVQITRNGESSGNKIAFTSDYAWVILRLYVPNADASESGRTLMGGVPLPSVTVTRVGASETLQTCSPVNDIADVRSFLQTLFPPGSALIGDEGTPSSNRLWFAPPTAPPVRLFPNPDNKYILMLPGDYQAGRIIVIHGKAPGFPDTFDGAPIWKPANHFRTVDMRYWSVCNNNFTLPIPAVGCLADLKVKVSGGYYTIVISDDLIRPDWLPRNVNWMPWGDEQYPKLVFFRNMLPSENFPYSIESARAAGCTFDFNFPQIPDRTAIDEAGQCAQQVMGDYYPVAAWCDRSTFRHGGWRACLMKERFSQ